MSKPSTKHQEHEAASAEAALPHVEAPPVVPAQAPVAPPQATAVTRHNSPLPLPRCELSHAADGNTGNLWFAKIPKDTPFEDVLQDWFWANRAKDMKPGDEIRYCEETWKYFGRVWVQQTRIVGPGVVPNRVSVILETHTAGALPEAQANLDGMFTSYEGLHKKWCVMQRGRPDPIREGYDSQPEAEKARASLALTRTEPRRPDAWHG
jgi:hypothetical protein